MVGQFVTCLKDKVTSKKASIDNMAKNKFAFSIPDLAVKKLLLQEESSVFQKGDLYE